MNPSSQSLRHKAVWGPKRTASAFLIAFTCIAPSAMAAGRGTPAPKAKHARVAKHGKAGAPNSNARPYKMDKELTFRARHHGALQTTRVVVRLQPNAALPNAYKPYARGRKLLGVLRSYTLDVPN